MATAGELLRDERLRRGRSITEIAEQTRISGRYLEAIETDHLNDLPGEFFHRAFVRQYATALGLDPDTMAKVLDAAGPAEPPDPVPVLNAAYENAQTGADKRPRVPTGLLIMLLIAAVLGGSGLYSWWQHVQSQKERTAAILPAEHTESRSSAETAVPVSASAAEDIGSQAGQALAHPTASETPPAGPAQLALSATEAVWISLESGGERVFSGTLAAGDTRTFNLAGGGRMVTGNAGGLTGTYAGKPLGEIGPRGGVRVISFSDGNFEVRDSRRKSQMD